MTINGFLRLMAAESRRQERARIRAAKEEQQEILYQQKIALLEEAQEIIAEYDAQIKKLQTLHVGCSEEIDWHAMASIPDPIKPEEKRTNANRVRYEIDNYKPSVLERVFFVANKKRAELVEDLHKAIKNDQAQYEIDLQEWKNEGGKLAEMRSLAKGVLANREEDWEKAFKVLCPIDAINTVATSVSVKWDSPIIAEITLEITSDEVIPKTVYSLTKRGELSEKPISEKKQWEMYEDLVCAAAIRVARELFAVLPFQSISVHCSAIVLNKEAGHDENQTVLSVYYPRK